MIREDLMELFSAKFKSQMGLHLSEILTIEDGSFKITPDNKMGLSMASLQLDLTSSEHGLMATFLDQIAGDIS